MRDIYYIYKPSIAHRLCQLGYQIVDVHPQDRLDGSKDFTRCKFLFKYEEGIDIVATRLIEQSKERNNTK